MNFAETAKGLLPQRLIYKIVKISYHYSIKKECFILYSFELDNMASNFQNNLILNNSEAIINLESTAIFLGISTATVRNWVKCGYLQTFSKNTKYFFHKKDIEKLKNFYPEITSFGSFSYFFKKSFDLLKNNFLQLNFNL